MKDPNVMKSHYFATPLAFNAPDGGFPWDDLRKILQEGQRMYKIAKKYCRKFQPSEYGARTLQTTDRRQTTDGFAVVTYVRVKLTAFDLEFCWQRPGFVFRRTHRLILIFTQHAKLST